MAIASSLMLAVVVALGAGPGLGVGSAPPLDPTRHATPVPGPVETPSTTVDVGDQAPDFSFKSYDGEWRRLADLRVHGPVLLVLAPDKQQLLALQSERDRLLDLGVVPIAVCDVTSRSAYAMVRELHLGFSVFADPQHVIAAQFNAVDTRTLATDPAWFVVDQKGRVRAMGHDGFPPNGYGALVSEALGIPGADAAKPASTH